MHQMVTYHFLCLRTPPTPHKCWLIYWGDGRRPLVIGLVCCRGVGCHRLSPVVTGCGLLVVGCRLLLILGPLVDSGNSDNGDRPRRCW
jgi:hypothetical protein